MSFRLQSVSVSFGCTAHTRTTSDSLFALIDICKYYSLRFHSTLVLDFFCDCNIAFCQCDYILPSFLNKKSKKGSRSCHSSSSYCHCCWRSYFVIFNPIETINGCVIMWLKWIFHPHFMQTNTLTFAFAELPHTVTSVFECFLRILFLLLSANIVGLFHFSFWEGSSCCCCAWWKDTE